MINILVTMFVVSYIVDISGVVVHINSLISRLLFGRTISGFSVYVLSCSRCLTFWSVLVLSIIGGHSLAYVFGMACLSSALSGIMSKLILFVQYILETTIDKLMS